MKKLYTTLLAACTLFAASAALPQGKAVNVIANGFTQQKELKLNTNMRAASTATTVASLGKNTNRHRIGVVKPDEDWVALEGTATFNENLVTSLFFEAGVTFPVEVTVEKSATTEGRYRIVNPYEEIGQTLAQANPNIISYSPTNAEPMILNVVNDTYFYFEEFDTGIAFKGAEITAMHQAAGLVANYGIDLALEAAPDVFYTFENNNFLFNKATFYLNGQEYANCLLYMGEDRYIGNAHGKTTLSLPGAEAPKDYSVKIVNDGCADDNTFAVDINLGADAEIFKLFIINGEYPASTDLFQQVVELSQNVFNKADVTSLTLDASGYGEGIYTIFAVTVDENNTLQEGDRALFYVIKDNDDQWTTLEGKAIYTDDFLASIYNSHEVTAPHEVTIQENNTTPGYYRLVNPYAAPYEFAERNDATCTHNHYMYINASDPEKVYIEESPIGVDYGDGAMAVMSIGYAYMLDETPAEEIPAEAWGTLKDDAITFPTESLLFRELKYNNGAWSTANGIKNTREGVFKVDLSKVKTSGLGSIEAVDNNAPVEYFNLQGQRVSNPAAGQLMIKRQGTKVSKVVVR